MISKEMQKALNEQINKELYSAYYYLSMAAYLDNKNLDGMANFFKVQAQEEMTHVQKFYDYVNEQGGRVLLEAVAKPPTDFKDVEAVFAAALEHEQFVTKNINMLVDLAIKESDHATKNFLDWFVAEQVEEEASMDSILQKVRMVGGQPQALLMLDSLLAGRRAEAASQE